MTAVVIINCNHRAYNETLFLHNSLHTLHLHSIVWQLLYIIQCQRNDIVTSLSLSLCLMQNRKREATREIPKGVNVCGESNQIPSHVTRDEEFGRPEGRDSFASPSPKTNIWVKEKKNETIVAVNIS